MDKYLKRYMPVTGLLVDYAERFDGWDKHLGELFVVTNQRTDPDRVKVMTLTELPDKFDHLTLHSEAYGSRLINAEPHRVIHYDAVPDLIHRALLEVEEIKSRIRNEDPELHKYLWQNCQEKEELRTLIDNLCYAYPERHLPGFGCKKDIIKVQAFGKEYHGYSYMAPVEVVCDTMVYDQKLPKGSKGKVVEGQRDSAKVFWPDLGREYFFHGHMIRRCW